ncbi:MAG: VWA domain-containing protein [Acidobacteriota bacterium]
MTKRRAIIIGIVTGTITFGIAAAIVIPNLLSSRRSGQHLEEQFSVATESSDAYMASPSPTPMSAQPKTPAQEAEPNTESYTSYGVNWMTEAAHDPVSTFAIDVDTASYTITRRKLTEGTLPPEAAVRVEEFLNYFKYRYPQPNGLHPFSVHTEAVGSPFNNRRHLLLVGLQGRQIAAVQRPKAHLIFLVDTSGSMQSYDKIGLVKQSLRILVNNLQPGDTVALTTYAGGVKTVLTPTGIEDKEEILNAIEQLEAGGGTAMASGIQLAYQQAHANLETDAINRIIICSDGDANIGNTSPNEILKDIEGYAKQGITVSTIGFGMGNYKDTMMEQFADKGNGNYYYIDNLAQAKRIFTEQLTGTLQVIAKDVKVQVEFNPAVVARYRLIGYENRNVADEDFRNDQVDGGEIGAGHTVTALYELELQSNAQTSEFATVRLRYKAPAEEQSQEFSSSISMAQIKKDFAKTSNDFRFAVAVAAFAEVLRDSQEARDWSLTQIEEIAHTTAAATNPERQELVSLIGKAKELKLRAQ